MSRSIFNGSESFVHFFDRQPMLIVNCVFVVAADESNFVRVLTAVALLRGSAQKTRPTAGRAAATLELWTVFPPVIPAITTDRPFTRMLDHDRQVHVLKIK